jgi:ATP-dependent helicase/nuclease subunit A
VLDAVNAVFTRAAAEGEFGAYVPHSTACAAPPAGHTWSLSDASQPAPAALQPCSGWRDSLTVARVAAIEPRAQAEAAEVARAVQWAIHHLGVAPGDVMVLARRHAALAHVAEALRRLHVACVATEALRLGDLIEVRDLVATLDVLASPANDLSLAQALKSPLFGVSDGELLALSRRADRRATTPWWSALQSWPDAPTALARARELLAAWAADARQLPPHDLLDRVVHQGELLPRLAAAVPSERRGVAIAAVNALLGLSLSLDGGRHASVYRFVRVLRQCMVAVRAPIRDGAVQLLSIHGAKGLEARCVFVVDTDPNPARESDPDVLVDWPLEHDAPQRVAFIADLSAPCESLSAQRERERAAAQREELNALYVAMTRAREWLVFSRTAPRKAAGVASWWARVSPHATPMPRDDAAAGTSAHGEPMPLTVMELAPPKQRSPMQRSRAPAVAPAMPAAPITARLGQAVHRVLQWATATTEPPDFAAWAAAAGAEFDLPDDMAPAAAAIAQRIREQPALQRFFDRSTVLWSADEFDVMHQGELLRIDRLVRLGTPGRASWWVLDYKLALGAADDAALQAQLARYRVAVLPLAAGEPVHAAFITGDGALHEITPLAPTSE